VVTSFFFQFGGFKTLAKFSIFVPFLSNVHKKIKIFLFFVSHNATICPIKITSGNLLEQWRKTWLAFRILSIFGS